MFVHLMMGQGQTRDRTGTGTGTGHPNKKERNLKLKRKLQKCLKSHKYFNQVCPKISKDIEAHTHERRHGAAPEILKVASPLHPIHQMATTSSRSRSRSLWIPRQRLAFLLIFFLYFSVFSFVFFIST